MSLKIPQLNGILTSTREGLNQVVAFSAFSSDYSIHYSIQQTNAEGDQMLPL